MKNKTSILLFLILSLNLLQLHKLDYTKEINIKNKQIKVKPEAKGYGIWDNFHIYLGLKFTF